MPDRVHAFGIAVFDVVSRAFAFAAVFGGVGLGLNAYAAFGPGESDPRFSDEIIFASNNAVLLLIVGVTVASVLLGSAITTVVAPRQSLMGECLVTGLLGAVCMITATLLFAARSAEVVPSALAVLGVTSGVVSVWSPKSKSHGAGAA